MTSKRTNETQMTFAEEDMDVPLNFGDACIIIRADCSAEIILPEGTMSESYVPANVAMASAIGILAQRNPEWLKNTMREVWGEKAEMYFDDITPNGPQFMGRA